MGKAESKENAVVANGRISHGRKHVGDLQSLTGVNWNSADKQLPLHTLNIPLKRDTTPIFGNIFPC